MNKGFLSSFPPQYTGEDFCISKFAKYQGTQYTYGVEVMFLSSTGNMIGYPVELKVKISSKVFEDALARLNEKTKFINFALNQRIVYFADTPNLDVLHSEKVIIRFRWNNEYLESVIKVRHSPKYTIEHIRKEYASVPNHTLKIDGDGLLEKDIQWSFALKFFYQNISPSFTFFSNPEDYLSPEQKKLLKQLAPKVNPKELKYGIPIESSACKFDIAFKEFSSITLEEWKLPRLLWNKLFELSAKTDMYGEKSQKHLLKFLDELDIDISGEPIYKTNWYYHSYFNL